MREFGEAERTRRQVLATICAGGALAFAGGLALPAWAAADPDTAAARRLMALAAHGALARLSRRGGFWTSNVARIPLPKLFNPNHAWPGPLAAPAFREDLAHRLNTIAEVGARSAAPLARRASTRVAVPDPAAVLRGGPTSATTLLRAEIGPGLVNAITPPLARALRRANDPVIRRATAALKGVSADDVARALANGAESGIWYAIGAEEAAIRRDPARAGDPALAAALRAG